MPRTLRLALGTALLLGAVIGVGLLGRALAPIPGPVGAPPPAQTPPVAARPTLSGPGLAAPAAAPAPTPRPPAPARILEVLVEGESGALGGAEVTVEGNVPIPEEPIGVEAPAPASGPVPSPPETKRTDARGRARFDDVRAGPSAAVRVVADGHLDGTTTAWFDDVGPGPFAATVQLVRARRIEGTVVDGLTNAPVPGAEVRTSHRDSAPDATTDSLGRFRLDVDPADAAVTIRARIPGEDDETLDVRVWNGVLDPSVVRLVLRRPEPAPYEPSAPETGPNVVGTGTLEVLVVDADGSPRDADVGLLCQAPRPVRRRLDAPDRHPSSPWTEEAVRIAVGRYRAEKLPPLIADFTATAPGRLRARAWVRVLPDRETKVTLRMEHAVELAGLVVDGAENPVDEASVRCQSEPEEDPARTPFAFFDLPPDEPERSSVIVTTDALGRFRIPDGWAGTLRLLARAGREDLAEGVSFGQVVVAAPGPRVKIVLRRLANLRLHLVDAEGVVVTGEVKLNGLPFGHPSQFSTQADDEGLVELRAFRDGDHELSFEAGGYPARAVAFTVRDGADVDLGIVRLDAGATVRGRVVGPDDRPVERADVRLDGRNVKTGPDGVFEFDRVPRRRLTLTAAAPNFVAPRVFLDASKPVPVFDVRLGRGAIVRGPVAGGEAGDELAERLRFVLLDGAPADDREDVEAIPRPEGRYYVVLAAGRWEARERGVRHALDDEDAESDRKVHGPERRLATFTVKDGDVVELPLEVPTERDR